MEIFTIFHKRACFYQNHHPSHANNTPLWVQHTSSLILKPANTLQCMQCIKDCIYAHAFVSVSPAVPQYSAVTSLLEQEGRVNENGMDPIEAPPRGLVEQHSPWPSHSSPSSPAAVLSLSELAARITGVGVDVHAVSLSRLWFFCVSPSILFFFISSHMQRYLLLSSLIFLFVSLLQKSDMMLADQTKQTGKINCCSSKNT